MTAAADFDTAAYRYLFDPDDFDSGAIARIGAMLWADYSPGDWLRIRDQLIFSRCVRILGRSRGYPMTRR